MMQTSGGAPGMPGSSLLRWALYDWANSAYATVIIAGFFPIFFREFWNAGQPQDLVTLRLGVSNSMASVLIALSAPLLGALADQLGCRRCFLRLYAIFGMLATAALFFIPQGQWLLAAALYVIATAGFMGANVFYDAMLTETVPPRAYERASALGYSLGYLGGGLLFAGCAYASIAPQKFGLTDTGEAVRASFLVVALWWALFALPLLAARTQSSRFSGAALRASWVRLRGTLVSIGGMPQVLWFLIAYWLYIDGVDTVIFMAVDYGKALGFDSQDLILALLLTQFVGFPAALVFGRLGERFGPKRGILFAIAVYCVVTVWGSQLDSSREFYGIAFAIGCVQGGIQALSRSLYARLIPQDRAAEFFGFYNILGKFAAVVGPVMVGAVGAVSGSPRAGLLSILILFLAGVLLLLKKVPAVQPERIP
jgi:MFS transporter, UMF1 family